MYTRLTDYVYIGGELLEYFIMMNYRMNFKFKESFKLSALEGHIRRNGTILHSYG
jgi:hypothetical protein